MVYAKLVFGRLQWKICLLYVDDMSNSLLKKLDIVYERLNTARFKLKPSECYIFQNSVEFLSHVVSDNGVSVLWDFTHPIVDILRILLLLLSLCMALVVLVLNLFGQVTANKLCKFLKMHYFD